MKTSEILADIMHRKNMKATDLARESGVGEGRISQILSGATLNPRLETMKKLSKALGVSISELTGEGYICESISEEINDHCPNYESYRHPNDQIQRVIEMMEGMDDDTQADVCLSIQKEKLLRELLKKVA